MKYKNNELNKNELKKVVQIALKKQYGFQPALKSIVLLEATGDGSYILLEINKHEYRFDAYNGGTIEQHC